MSVIDRKHFYRFKYLKSDHWQNLRLEKLVSVDAHCENCKVRDLSNDVHHLNYRKLYDVQLSDLVVLCRRCHELAHEALAKHRDFIKKPGQEVTWDKTKAALHAILKGLDVPTNAGFKEWRKLERGRKIAAKYASERECSRPLIEEKLQKAQDEAERRSKNEQRRKTRPPCVKDGLSKGFGNPETKQLFIELRRLHFWDESWSDAA